MNDGGDLPVHGAPGRTGWETEHLDDPVDDVERYVEVPIPGLDVDPPDWKSLAETYRRDADYWHGRALDLIELLDKRQGRAVPIRSVD